MRRGDFITNWRMENYVKPYVYKRLNPIYSAIGESLVTLSPEPLTRIPYSSPIRFITVNTRSDRVEGWAENNYMMLKRLAIILTEALAVNASNPNDTIPLTMDYGFKYVNHRKECIATSIDIEIHVPREYEELARNVISGIDSMWAELSRMAKEKGWVEDGDGTDISSCEYHPCGGTYTVINGVLMIRDKNYRVPSLIGDCYGYNSCTEPGHRDVVYTGDFLELVNRINPRDENIISGFYRFIDTHGGIIYFKTVSGIKGSVSVDYDDLRGYWLVDYDEKDKRYEEVKMNKYMYISDVLTDITLEYPDWEGSNTIGDCL